MFVAPGQWLPGSAGLLSGIRETGVAEAAEVGAPEPSASPAGRAWLRGPEMAECDATPEHPCPLGVDAPTTAAFSRPGDVHAYRFFALDAGARARLELADAPAGTRVRLLGWGARPLAEATVTGG